LGDIYGEYSFFLGENYLDTLNIIRMYNFLTDPMIQGLKIKVDEVFPSLDGMEEELALAFKYIKYYFPGFKTPEVFSYISGLYYEAPIEYFDSVMIISLDLYLGSDFEPYRSIGLPKYKTRRMNAQHLIPECMKQVGLSLFPEELPHRSLLDQMIYHGKLLYFLDLVLPSCPDSLKIGYRKDEMDWCENNDSRIWAFILERDLLYSTDPFVVNKFIQDGPFTTGFPEESPAMIGRWTGWQIVRAFMQKEEDITLKELFELTDNQDILSRSRYKPSR
jgi:hypothetical protein